jgi:hypothetical protein
MSEKRKKYDLNAPEAKPLIDQIVHGTFVRQGTMVAFPMCFPGVTVPIPADESHVTALAVVADGAIYGGTSGRAAHLFVAMFHGVTGLVFDRGMIDGADHCAAVGCGKKKFVACLNGPGGGRVVASDLEPLPHDLIQEWTFSRRSLEDAGTLAGERIVHAVTDDSSTSLVGVTADHLFTVDIEGGRLEIVGQVPGRGRIAVGLKGGIFGQDATDHLWRYDVPSRQIKRQAVKLPDGAWDKVPLTWARDHRSGLLYTADANGTLFSLDEDHGFSPPLGQTLLAPVGPMAVTHDGRVFGFCGPAMAKMFCYDPTRKEVRDLGVAVSVLERRRYGYVFGDAVTGRDGQIIFGEDDDLGHLWLYFPRIRNADLLSK